MRRFSETRRPHPLAVNQPAIEGIREEREALSPIRKMADLILDTSDYTVHQLRDYIHEHYDLRDGGRAPGGLRDVLRLQVRRARRRPTWSSTCASCPTPTSCRA